MYGQEYGSNWETRSESKMTRMENEKPKLDNARRLRGIYSIDPDDEEYKETLLKREEEIGKTYGSSHAVQKQSSH